MLTYLDARDHGWRERVGALIISKYSIVGRVKRRKSRHLWSGDLSYEFGFGPKTRTTLPRDRLRINSEQGLNWPSGPGNLTVAILGRDRLKINSTPEKKSLTLLECSILWSSDRLGILLPHDRVIPKWFPKYWINLEQRPTRDPPAPRPTDFQGAPRCSILWSSDQSCTTTRWPWRDHQIIQRPAKDQFWTMAFEGDETWSNKILLETFS